MNTILENEPLSEHTTLKIGGPAKLLVEVNSEEDLVAVLTKAIREETKFLVIGSGSDLLVSDSGYDGLVVVNNVIGVEKAGNVINVQAGTIFQDMIDFANINGLSGIEKMAGIPGTIGGAIYGNAGAYGQTISDRLISVEVFKNGKLEKMSKADCKFEYRESIFKDNKDWTIISASFELKEGDSDFLTKTSLETIELRSKKYPPGIKCPGSFFKNIIAASLSKEVLDKIPPDKIVYGKVPAGFLLEIVGANSDKLGGIEIASYHGNLFVNKNNGTASDFFNLAKKYKDKVYEKFGISLEPEVQLVGFKEKL